MSFHTETIKAVKQGFGTTLNGVPSLLRVYCHFIGTHSSVVSASVQPGLSPETVAVAVEACVNEGHLFWLGILESWVSFVSMPAAPVLGLVHAWTPGSETVGSQSILPYRGKASQRDLA